MKINELIEKYKKKIVDLKGFKGDDRYLQKQENNYYQEIIKDLEELKVEYEKLQRDKNLLENYYYDDMFTKGKVSNANIYAKFKGLGDDKEC